MSTGSYTIILKHLLSEYPFDLHLNCAVKNISVEETTSSRPRVVVECGNGERYEADMCLVTVPLAVLKKNAITFSPARPAVMERLASRYNLGLMNLVWLWFPRKFWGSDCNFIGVARGSGLCESEYSAQWQPSKFSTFLAPPVCDSQGNRQAVLMCQVVGSFAESIESMSDAGIAAVATDELRRLFGSDVVPDPIGCVSSRWRSDEFAGGSYSYRAMSGRVPRDACVPCYRQQDHFHKASLTEILTKTILSGNQVSRDRDASSISSSIAHDAEDLTSSSSSIGSDATASASFAPANACVEDRHAEESEESESLLQPWVNRLVRYAGEAMNFDQRGTVHGAYISGQAAADRILRYLSDN